jgi:hypothetical protein
VDVNITGGTNAFYDNRAGHDGGAVLARGNGTFRATDGDFVFQGNVAGAGSASERANAIHMTNDGNNRTLTLAAEAGRSVVFYDPVTSDARHQNLTININDRSTDTGTVVFDGSLYGRDIDRHSAVSGNTSVGFGELALKGNVTYGAASDIGSFTLGREATLSSDVTSNRIQANQIMIHGALDIAYGGTLELAAANGVHFNGILSIGLGTLAPPEMFTAFDTFSAFSPASAPSTFSAFSAASAPIAFNTPLMATEAMSTGLSINGDLTFGHGATMSLYWDDFDLTNDWSFSYNLSDFFTATGSVTGIENLIFDMSAFYMNDGFDWTWNNGLLLLSYTMSNNAATPEPATLAMIGLGLAGLGYARRRQMKRKGA